LFHLFTYSRQYFVGLTLFDIICITLMIPAAVYISYAYRTRPILNIIIGFFGLAGCGYFGLFNTPFSDYPSEAPIKEFFYGLIKTEQGALNFGFTLMFSMILISGIMQFWYWERTIRQQTMHEKNIWSLNMALAILLSLGFYIAFIFAFDNSLESVFYCLAFVSSAFLFIIGLIPGKIPKVYFTDSERILIQKMQEKPTLETQTKLIRMSAFFLNWLTCTLYIVLASFLYQQYTNVDNRVVTVLNFLECLLLGGGLILVINMNTTISKWYKILGIGVMPVALWILAKQGMNGALGTFSMEAGIVVFTSIWIYLQRTGRYSKTKLDGCWFVMILAIAGYFSFIPAHLEDVAQMVNEIDVYLTVIVAIDLLNLYIFSKLPDVYNEKNYLKTIERIHFQKNGNLNQEEKENV